jgi:hypothetical protein
MMIWIARDTPPCFHHKRQITGIPIRDANLNLKDVLDQRPYVALSRKGKVAFNMKPIGG